MIWREDRLDEEAEDGLEPTGSELTREGSADVPGMGEPLPRGEPKPKERNSGHPTEMDTFSERSQNPHP